MWATLALTAALSMTPGQTGALKLTNDRATYGYLGPTRADDALLPGDIYFVHFDIENLSADELGNGKYSIGLKLTNSAGKVIFETEPVEKPFVNSLGGTRTPGYAQVQIGTDTPAGNYTLKVAVTDPKMKKTEAIERKFEVKPKAFGVVHMRINDISADPRNASATPIRVVGDVVLLNCAVVGFERDKAKMNQPNIGLEVAVVDDKGKPTLPKPITDQVTKDVPEQISAVPITLPLALNRPGRYTIKLQATDRITKKTVEATLPLQVLDPK
jgi:hypothetical protein